MRVLSLFVLELVLCAATLFAQIPTTGQILGVARDSTGLAMPGVQVHILNTQTGQQFSAATSDAGDYEVRGLPSGLYTVTGEKEGFKKVVRQQVTVTEMQNVRVDLRFEVGTVSQTVEVSGEPPLVDTHSATLGTLVDGKRITDLPLNGRNVLSLAALVPGVSRTSLANTVSSGQQAINVNGNRSYSTNMQLDGGSMYYAHRGQGLIMPPPDAVEEMKIVTAGVTAEYGRGTAVISLITKSGTNELHGSAWEYLRNDDFDARNPSNLTKSKLRYNQFGSTIGGPILKNRFFFFGSYQGLRIRQDSSSTSAFPPTAAEREGDFSASNPAPVDPTTGLPFPNRIIPKSQFDPVAVKLLDKIPLPNDPSGRLLALTSSPNTGDDVVGKFDYQLHQADRLSFRFFFDYQRGITAFPVVISPGSNIPGYSPAPNSDDAKSLTLTDQHTWSSRLISTTRATFVRFVYDESNAVRETLSDLGAKNFVNGGGPPRLPQIIVNGRFTASPGKDNQRWSSTYEVGQDWDWMHGRHEIKWGFQLQKNRYTPWGNTASSGRFTFDGTITKNPMADYLLGLSVNFNQNSLDIENGRYWVPAFYGQDTIKVTPRLTVNLGLRWEIYTPWRDEQGQMASLVPGVQSQTFPTAPLGMIYQTDPQYNYNTDAINAGPRIGFAWDVFGDGKTSVRGGYAVSYDGFLADQLLGGNQPYVLNVTVSNPGPLSDPYLNTPNPFPYTVDPAKSVFVLPMTINGGVIGSKLDDAYNQNVSLTVERQLTRNLMLKVGYVGNFARKLLDPYQANPAVYIPGKDASGKALSTTANVDSRRIYGPTYQGLWSFASSGTGSYNGLQTVLTKRFSGGFTLLANYTWSKALDDTCTNEVASSCAQQDPNNRHGSRGRGDQDRAHVFVASYLYDLPFFKNSKGILRQAFGGWQIAGINRFQTGGPLTIRTGVDASLTGVGFDRPNLIADPNLPSDRSREERMAEYFNTAAFVANAPGTYGSAGRNILTAPGEISMDMTLQKQFHVTEKHTVEFRTDFFNTLNHPNLGSPGTNLSSPQSFGKINGVSGSRIIQLALRYEF
ncbi:MAG TPA: TonB-dependent receptor [Bryobacteraceae bacterium]|nr:TonB-dependent receptor [Bryobacteraceae bacterium]